MSRHLTDMVVAPLGLVQEHLFCAAQLQWGDTARPGRRAVAPRLGDTRGCKGAGAPDSPHRPSSGSVRAALGSPHRPSLVSVRGALVRVQQE